MKTIIRTLCVAALLSTAIILRSFSQAPAIEWQKSFGGSGSDEAFSTQQTSDGGYIVAGYANSGGGDVHGNHGGFDYWVVKLNALGDTLWTKTYGGSSSDHAHCIQQTSEGGYIVAGYTSSNNGDVSGNHGSNDCWIVKLNSSGGITWTKTLGGSAGDLAAFVRQTTDGGYIVAGYTQSNNGDVHGLHGSNVDYWIVKLNAQGDTLWTKTLGGTLSEYAQCIQQTSDGGYIVTGFTGSNDGDVSGHHGPINTYDYWVVKLDNSGNITWTKSLGGSQDDIGRSVHQTSDGGYLVSGTAQSNNGNVSGNHGAYDSWIVKLDASGNIIWQNALGGSGEEDAYAVCQTPDGGFIIAGHANSTNGDVSGNHGDRDYWIVRLDASGDTVWTKSMGGSYFDLATSIQVTSDCGYIVAGYSASTNFDINNFHGGTDYWIIKLAPDPTVFQTFYADVDADGYGNPNATTLSCSAPPGYISNNTDCNDANPAIRPNSTEVCNSVDDDCDGQIDEGVKSTFYADADGDGYGTISVMTQACSAPSGYVSNSTDCNDANNAVHPNATEICNSIDDDCDSLTDDDDPSITGQPTWYADADGDGSGNPASSTLVCNQPTGYVSNNTDCNDVNNEVHPGATEICNGIDDDCDGFVDDSDPGVTGQGTYYADNDGDSYGAGAPILACIQPPNTSTNDEDCNDNNASINPAATEVCNGGIDDDCDGLADDADPSVTGQSTWYADADGDGFGNAGSSTLACNQPPGYVSNAADCDDADLNVNPAATETCNGMDDECDGFIDDADPSITGQPIWYADADGDGFGNAGSSTPACNQPSGYIFNSADCDDANNEVHPGATEICNGGVDDDCDGLSDDADPGITGQGTYYADNDGDGYGAGLQILACVQPANTSTNNDDCNDGSVSINPGATEVCNGVDDDCDGLIDDSDPSVTGQPTWYADADGDSYGDVSNSVLACDQPSGYVANDGDCNDVSAAVNPAAAEICNNTNDDCDGSTDEGFDLDGDSYTTCAGDCNDADPAFHPGASEVLNGLDDNCNGQTDEGLCILSVSAGADESSYFGYPLDQCIVKAVIITDGTGPFVYSWTLDRPLQYDVITSAGDESMTGSNSASVTLCLLDTAVLCITVTDANGCTASDCANIYAEDVRCFAGNSGQHKVKVCHNNKTICVAESAVDAHTGHGDYIGKCQSSKEEDEILTTTMLQLYPNPADRKFTLDFHLNSKASAGVVQVIDMIGRIVYEQKIAVMSGEFHQEIQLNGAADGIYMVKVVVNDEVYTRQLVLSKQ